MTLRSIAVPLDGSLFGEHALPHALGLARRSGARLELVHVHVPGGPFDLPVGDATPSADEDRRATDQARRYLDDVLCRVKVACPGIEVTSTLLNGRVIDSLCDFMTRSGPELVVLTTHGRGPLSRFWFGGVTTELIQRSPAPLMLVRPGEGKPDLTADPAPRRVMIPLDGSPFGEHVIPLAVAVGSLTGAAYRLLRVVPPVLTGETLDGARRPSGGFRTTADRLASEARSYLTALAMHSPALGTAEAHVAVDWPPAGAILADADASGSDLIAMSTRGHGGLVRLLLGSVADKVVRGTTLPVLLHRPGGEPGY